MSLVTVNQSRAMTRKRRGKKKNRRRRNYRGSVVPSSMKANWLGGFPDSVKVKLRYCQIIRLNLAGATPDQHLFRCIAPQNPSYTAITDHQPMYYDQWSSIYTHYTVLGSKIRMDSLPGSNVTSNQPNGFFGIYTTTDTQGIDVFTDDIGVLEANNSTNMRIAGLLTGSNSTPSKSAYAMSKFSTRKFFGCKDPQDGGAYSALTTSIPNQEAYWACYYSPIGTNDPATQQFLITIEYIIEFRDRRPVDIS